MEKTSVVELQRIRPERRPNLEETLFRRPRPAQVDGFEAAQAELQALRSEIERLRRKLAAIEAIPSIDRSLIQRATAHTRLVCRASGYSYSEVDDPPPPVGAHIVVDDEPYTVWALQPTPADPRRCAVLVSRDFHR